MTSYLKNSFAIDCRALAVLRMGLGLIMLWQIGVAYSERIPFYTDQGVLPRPLQREILDAMGMESAWSLYSLTGAASGVGIGLLVQALAALGLLIGFQTRLATIISLVMVWSLQMRNPLITTGGDVLLRCFLAWCIFLPLGASWSLDRLRRGKREGPRTVSSLATAGIMLQLTCMYFFAGVAKWNDDWMSGRALSMTLELEMYLKPAGNWLRQFVPNEFLSGVTWLTLILELICPAMLFSPWKQSLWRSVAATLFCLMHLGIWLTMSIGIFSAVSIVAWVIFLPRSVWERFAPHKQVSSESRSRLETSAFAGLTNFAMLSYMLAINVMNTAPSTFAPWGHHGLQSLGCACLFIQEFKMFGHPPHWNPQFHYWGSSTVPENIESTIEADGVKFFDGRNDDPAHSEFEKLKTQSWRRYHWNLIEIQHGAVAIETEQRLNDRLLQYQVERWNQLHVDQQIRYATLRCRLRPIPSDQLAEELSANLWAEFAHRAIR